MNELVIFNDSLVRALNSSFKCYELAVCEKAKAQVLVRSRRANGMVSKDHVIPSPTSCFSFFQFENLRLHAFLSLQRYLAGCSKTINPSTDTFPSHPLHIPCSHSVCLLTVRRSPPPNPHQHFTAL